MLKDGFYSTTVTGPFGSSNGVIHLLDGTINGGDDYMVYQGTLSSQQFVQAKALVYRENDIHTGKRFELDATAIANSAGFVATGKYPDGAAFKLEARFISGSSL